MSKGDLAMEYFGSILGTTESYASFIGCVDN